MKTLFFRPCVLILSIVFLILSVPAYAESTSAIAIEPGDTLNIQVKGENDLSGVFEVGADGKVTYPLIGSVYINGLYLVDVEEILMEMLGKDYLVNPEVKAIFFNNPKRAPVSSIPKRQESASKPSKKRELAASSVIDIVDVGDKIHIEVYKEPDLSGVFIVNSSGKITYPLLGDVHAQGITLDQLRDYMYAELNEKFVTNPQLELSFTGRQSKTVSVLGQVGKPGNFILTKDQTLLNLLPQLGGFSQNAAIDTVRIVRSVEDGKKKTINANVKKIIEGVDKDPALMPGDIIFVDAVEKQDEQKKVKEAKTNVTLLGQIAKPGNYFFAPDLTLIRLVGQAGGFTPVAATSRVRVVRQGDKGQRMTLQVNANKIMTGNAKDFEVKKGDLIVVPESFF